MSKNILKYQDTKFVKTKKKKKKRFWAFVFCVLMLVGVIMFSNVLADAIKVGNFSFLFSKTNIKSNQHSYYAVAMGEYDSESEAQAVASGVSIMGAGGYVWYDNQKYYVIGNVYKTKEESEIVLKNITGTNYNTFIKEMVFKKIDYNAETLTKEQRKVVKDGILFLNQIYEKCYNYAIKFDKGEIVSTVISSELNTLNGEVKVLASKLDAINSVAVTNQTLLLKNAMINVGNELENAVLKVINGSSVNKDLKYLTTSVAVIKYNFYNEIYKVVEN